MRCLSFMGLEVWEPFSALLQSKILFYLWQGKTLTKVRSIHFFCQCQEKEFTHPNINRNDWGGNSCIYNHVDNDNYRLIDYRVDQNQQINNQKLILFITNLYSRKGELDHSCFTNGEPRGSRDLLFSLSSSGSK